MKFKGIGFITVEPEQLQLPMDLGPRNYLENTTVHDDFNDQVGAALSRIESTLDVLLKGQAEQAQAIALVQQTLSAIIEKVGLV